MGQSVERKDFKIYIFIFIPTKSYLLLVSSNRCLSAADFSPIKDDLWACSLIVRSQWHQRLGVLPHFFWLHFTSCSIMASNLNIHLLDQIIRLSQQSLNLSNEVSWLIIVYCWNCMILICWCFSEFQSWDYFEDAVGYQSSYWYQHWHQPLEAAIISAIAHVFISSTSNTSSEHCAVAPCVPMSSTLKSVNIFRPEVPRKVPQEENEYQNENEMDAMDCLGRLYPLLWRIKR
jgi:hypothetical protein